MLSCKRCLPFAVVSVLLAWNAARAAEGPAAVPAEKAQAAPSVEEIDKLIRQLDADAFADRQAASQKLAQVGKPAIPALEKAAVGESLEVTTRAIDLLRKFYEGSDAAAKDAAKAALESIAKSDRPSAARRAQEVLKPKADPNAPNNVAPGGGIILGGPVPAIIQGNIQIAAGAKKISVKSVNGVKEIDVEEGDKKIKINDDPKNGIKVEITTKKDGKEVTDKYEAKDAEELKKKHPEGYKVYEQYGKNAGGAGGAIQIQIGGGNVPIIPAVPVPVPAQPRVINAGRNEITIATTLLRSSIQRLERLSKEALKDAPQETKDELKKQIGEMKRVIGDLEKQLEGSEKPADKAGEKPAAPAADAASDAAADRAPEKR